MRATLCLALLACGAPAFAEEVVLLHEKVPPVWLRLTLPAEGELTVKTLPAAQPASLALTAALAKALGEKPSAKGAAALMKRLDTDEDGVLTPLELVPELLTAKGAKGRPRFSVVVTKDATKAGDWLGDVAAHYEDVGGKWGEKELAAYFASHKPVEVKLAFEGARQVKREDGLTLDLAATRGGARPAKVTEYNLHVAPQPRCWWSWLDADQDGQLSAVELRDAWDRLADEGARKAGKLSLPDAKETHYSLTLLPGKGADHGVRLRRPERAAAGPAWFRAMDRNSDGYVSRGEWLGTKEAFDKIDVNGDGLIAPKEAEGGEKR